MRDEGVIIVFKGERKNLRGKYRVGTCIITPKGLFLFSESGWVKMIEEYSKYDFKTGKCTMTYRFEQNKEQKGKEV